MGWDKQKAINTPVAKKRRKWKPEYIAVAQEHGIPRNTFENRIVKGWNLQEAMTKPVQPRSEAYKNLKRNNLS